MANFCLGKVGIDWAGIVLERVTGMSLNEYIQKNICQPLGLKNMNMIPTEPMKNKLAYMHFKGPDGKLEPRDHLLRRPLVISSPQETAGCFNSGGAGMFAKPGEYARRSHTLSKMTRTSPVLMVACTKRNTSGLAQ
jgi:CubicO group peptidase (beta-lactamase class C family)